jgi:hypothetical protein
MIIFQLTGLRLAAEKGEEAGRGGPPTGPEETWATVSLASSAHTTPGSYKKGEWEYSISVLLLPEHRGRMLEY